MKNFDILSLDFEEVKLGKDDFHIYPTLYWNFILRLSCYDGKYVTLAKEHDEGRYTSCQFYLNIHYDQDEKEFYQASLEYYTEECVCVQLEDDIDINELTEEIKYIEKYVDIDNIETIDKILWNETTHFEDICEKCKQKCEYND